MVIDKTRNFREIEGKEWEKVERELWGSGRKGGQGGEKTLEFRCWTVENEE